MIDRDSSAFSIPANRDLHLNNLGNIAGQNKLESTVERKKIGFIFKENIIKIGDLITIKDQKLSPSGLLNLHDVTTLNNNIKEKEKALTKKTNTVFYQIYKDVVFFFTGNKTKGLLELDALRQAYTYGSKVEKQLVLETKKELFYAKLGFANLPDFPENDLHVKLPDGTETLLTPENCRQLYSGHLKNKILLLEKSPLFSKSENEQKWQMFEKQSHRFPLMEKALSALRTSFDELDELHYSGDQEGVKSKTKEIATQLNNISSLATIVDSLTQNKDYASALLDIQNHATYEKKGNGWIASELIIPEAVLQGHVEITEEISRNIHQNLQNKLIASKKPKDINLSDLQQQREKSPITKGAIAGQSQLQKAIREGKGWATDQSALVPQGESFNQVFKLNDAAFFKMGAEDEKAAGTMETLMWNFALILGHENQFVPTGETKIHTTGDAVKAAIQWNKEGELSVIDSASKAKEGGIQPAQKGMTLSDYLEDPSKKGQNFKIERSEILDAGLTAITFGMWDAHLGNIFVTDEGKLKFFDNTRSMPNSNGGIRWNDQLFKPTFRCGLFILEESYTPISQEERQRLLQIVKTNQNNMQDLKAYLDSAQGKSMLAKLPAGWLNVEGALTAMKERLDLMEKELESSKSLTLCDLMMNSNPGYRFNFAVAVAGILMHEDLQPDENLQAFQRDNHIHTLMGMGSEVQKINNLANWGFDVNVLKAISENPTYSPERQIQEISKHAQEAKMIVWGKSPWNDKLKKDAEMKIRKENAENLIATLSKQAALDNKDLSRDLSVQFAKANIG